MSVKAKKDAVVKGVSALWDLAKKEGTDLADDAASRMARAAEQGYDTDVFHYSRRGDDIEEFSRSKWDLSPFSIGPHVGSKKAAFDRFTQTGGEGRPRNVSALPGSTIWERELRATPDSTYQLKAKTGNQFTNEGNPWSEGDLSQHLRNMQVEKFGEDFHDYDAANQWLADEVWKKYDSIPYVNDVEDPGNISYIMNPKNLRSVNAAFDPAKKDSANLLAGLGGAAVLGSSLAPEDAEAAVWGKPIPYILDALTSGKKLLFHSGDASLAEDIAKNGISPQHGPWIQEVLAGSVDDVEGFLDGVPEAAWYSEKPDWVKIKAARASGKSFDKVTDADIEKYGHLSIVDPQEQYQEGAEFYRMPSEMNGEYTEVTDLYNDPKLGRNPPQKLYQTSLYSESNFGPSRMTEGLEPNDIVTTEVIDPITTLTGTDLVDFLKQYNGIQTGNADPALLGAIGVGAATTTALAPEMYRQMEETRRVLSDFAQLRAPKASFWKQKRDELLELAGAGVAAATETYSTLQDKGFIPQGTPFADFFSQRSADSQEPVRAVSALAALVATQDPQKAAGVYRMPQEQIADEAGGLVTDYLSQAGYPGIAPAAGTAVNVGVNMAGF